MLVVVCVPRLRVTRGSNPISFAPPGRRSCGVPFLGTQLCARLWQSVVAQRIFLLQ